VLFGRVVVLAHEILGVTRRTVVMRLILAW